ncbi:hypothetical protein DFH09DRAFT_1286249 [Mycena vulgaris]|nr:hypothetical protein DFH09DRAFT_1286249 [Mycena vulgaris]
MSAEEIQARIAQVSAVIERQKEVLQKLERSKRVLQRQLNDVRDPVARLPLEISSEIFSLCLPSRPQPGAGYVKATLQRSLGSLAQTRAQSPLAHLPWENLGRCCRQRHQQYTEHLKGLEIFADEGNAAFLPTMLETFTLAFPSMAVRFHVMLGQFKGKRNMRFAQGNHVAWIAYIPVSWLHRGTNNALRVPPIVLTANARYWPLSGMWCPRPRNPNVQNYVH